MTTTKPEERRNRWRTNTSMRTWMVGLIALIGMLLIIALALLFGWLRLPGTEEVLVPTPDLLAGVETEDSQAGVLGGSLVDAQAPAEPAATIAPQAGDAFLRFYATRGTEPLFGRPISGPELLNGRTVQYYERVRLEYWPEFAGTPYEVQLGRLGSEYTTGRDFPNQSYVAGRSDLVYFPETEHSVGEPFLSRWRSSGGLDMFGFPISEAFVETLPNGEQLLVQYFERARFEYHPDEIDPAWQVQFGLLGTAIYRQEPRPTTVPTAPTAVPLS